MDVVGGVTKEVFDRYRSTIVIRHARTRCIG